MTLRLVSENMANYKNISINVKHIIKVLTETEMKFLTENNINMNHNIYFISDSTTKWTTWAQKSKMEILEC